MAKSETLQTLHSTGKSDWGTPWDVYRSLDHEFRFGLDAAAFSANAKHPNYLGPDRSDPARRDALTADWTAFCEPDYPAVWLNPPHSREVGKVNGVWMVTP